MKLRAALLLAPFASGNLLGGSGLVVERFGGHRHHVDHVLRSSGTADARPEGNSTTYFYNEAVLDHFSTDDLSETQWSQRFYADASQWGGAGYPVFLYIGGEGPQGPVSPSLFMYELATEAKALVLALEHRFYGESQPVADMSDENLRYLTSHQALNDLARFVQYVKSFDPATKDTASTPPLQLPASAKNSPFVVFGGSYPGALSAWFKLKYPSLIRGAVASSAPVFAEYDFEQYAEVVGTALSYPLIGGSSQCFSSVATAVSTFHRLAVSTSPMGTSKQIPEVLKPCTPIASELDLSIYEAQVFGAFQGVVQYNLEGRPPLVSDLCNSMTNASLSGPLQRLEAALAQVYPDAKCLPSSWEKDMIAPLANVSFSGKACGLDCTSMRQWIWQSCNEFGYFQTTTSVDRAKNPFYAIASNNLTLAGQRVCQYAYKVRGYDGPQSNALGLSANSDYGARDLAGTNITVVNGNMDPWHALGIINASDPFYNAGDVAGTYAQRVTPTESIVFIDGTAHCRDMYATNAIGKDTEPIQWAHDKIRKNVMQYIS